MKITDDAKQNMQGQHSEMHSHEHGHDHSHDHLHEDDHTHVHSHVLPDGTVYEHTHESHVEAHVHNHAHSHGHVHANTKAVINRLARAIGHLESIKRMVEDGRDCCEVLVQLSAVKSALNNTGKIILQDHIEHCILDAIDSGDHEALEELNKAIDQFVK